MGYNGKAMTERNEVAQDKALNLRDSLSDNSCIYIVSVVLCCCEGFEGSKVFLCRKNHIDAPICD